MASLNPFPEDEEGAEKEEPVDVEKCSNEREKDQSSVDKKDTTATMGPKKTCSDYLDMFSSVLRISGSLLGLLVIVFGAAPLVHLSDIEDTLYAIHEVTEAVLLFFLGSVVAWVECRRKGIRTDRGRRVRGRRELGSLVHLIKTGKELTKDSTRMIVLGRCSRVVAFAWMGLYLLGGAYRFKEGFWKVYGLVLGSFLLALSAGHLVLLCHSGLSSDETKAKESEEGEEAEGKQSKGDEGAKSVDRAVSPSDVAANPFRETT